MLTKVKSIDYKAGAHMISGGTGNVLLMSMRRVADLVAYCSYYEFEDVIAEVTGADRVEISDLESIAYPRRMFKAVRHLTGSRDLAWAVTPKPSSIALEHQYEMFFPVFTNAYELFALATIPDWRKRCRMAACFIVEMWVHQMPRYLLELLGKFDHIFLGVRGPVDEIKKITGRPCTYLPLAADVLRFAPYPDGVRVIDICNIGRRSGTTHDAFLKLARDKHYFYYYDTVSASGIDRKERTFRVQNAAEHRILLSNLLKRSRYFVANRARVNDPNFTRGHEEISGRFYEGAASGTVMIGESPVSDDFNTQFGWEDSVIKMPFDSPNVGDLIAELDADPRRLAKARKANFRNAAMRHDWVYRLRTVYETCGIPPTPAMIARERQLDSIAAQAVAVWPET